jgi:hypothetical protein
MKSALVALAAFAACALPHAAFAETIVDGIALGTPLDAVLKTAGPPAEARSSDSGNALVWRRADGQTSVVVEAGAIDAIVYEPAAGTRVRVDVDGRPVTFVAGAFTLDQADEQLAADAQFSEGTTRTYVPAPGRELVLVFDERTKRLVTVAYGERGTIARIGYIKADDIATSVPYHAAIMNASAISGAGNGPAALIAYSIDRRGVVQTVSLLVRSGDAAFDERLANGLLDDKFTPAHLGGREIASTFYRMVHAP